MFDELLRPFPVVIAAPIHWGDQDSFGHVNNLMYLRWAETARVEYLTKIGLWERSPANNIGPILASITCHFRIPLTYPDTVHAGARITAVGNTSVRMAHLIVSERHGAVAAEVESTLVMLDYNVSKPVPVPEQVRSAIREFQGGRDPVPLLPLESR